MDFSNTREMGIPAAPVGRTVSLDHAAELLGVSRRTVYNRIREGRLQTIHTRLGSQRVMVDSVADLLRSSREAPRPPDEPGKTSSTSC